MSQEAAEGAEEEVERDIDDVEESDDEEEDALEEAIEEHQAAARSEARVLAASAAATMTGAFADVVVEEQRRPSADPKIVNHHPEKVAAELTKSSAARDQALGALTDVAIKRGLGRFVDLFFGLNSGSQGSQGSAVDPPALCARLDLSVRRQAVPGGADPALTAATARWQGMSDGVFWGLLSRRFSVGRVSVTDLADHLVLVSMGAKLTPLENAVHWLSPQQKATAVDHLVAATGAGTGGTNLSPNGTVDLAKMYECAMNLARGNRLLPRAAVCELVQLALGTLTLGVREGTAPFELSRQGVRAELGGGDQHPNQDVTEEKARESARQEALTLIMMTDPFKGVVAKSESDAARAMARDVREGSRDLAALTQHHFQDLYNALAARDGGPGEVASVDAALKKSGLLPALDAWSKVYRSIGTASGADIQSKLQAVHDAMISLQTDVGDPLASKDRILAISVITPLLAALSVEIAFETHQVLGGGITDVGGVQGGPLAALDGASMEGRNRSAALRARDLNGLAKFVTSSTKRFQGSAWAKSLASAADTWSQADALTATDVATASTQLDAQLTAIESTLSGVSAEQQYFARLAIDAVANAAADRLRGLGGTNDLDTILLGLDGLADKLDTHRQTQPIAGDLAQAWTTALSAIAKAPNLPVDVGDALRRWQTAVAAGDPGALTTASYRAIEALADARRRVEASTLSLADKVSLLSALDTIGSTMAVRLR